MWYEILLPAGIIFTAMTFGFQSGKFIMAAGHGKPFMKDLTNNTNIIHYRRDRRISGDAYSPQGLESISD